MTRGFKDSRKKFHPITNKKGVRKKRFDKSEIQSLIFPKNKFSISDAKKWAITHDFKANKADVTKNNIRIRQFNPNQIKRGGECRTIHLGSSSVQGVLCEVGVMRKKKDVSKPILETELNDILEDVTVDETTKGEIDWKKLDKVVKENIKEILERENAWKKGFSVDIQEVGNARNDTSSEGGYYQFDYQILEDGKKIERSGTVYGSISAGDIIDMNLELYKMRAW